MIRRIRGDRSGQTGFGAGLGVGLRIYSYRCEEAACGGLLRPHVVWFGENLDPAILEEVHRELALCDLCLVVGHTLL